ncbi:MAG: hypothetical protein ACREXT_08220 [Gammaproteobacteria bacterium]
MIYWLCVVPVANWHCGASRATHELPMRLLDAPQCPIHETPMLHVVPQDPPPPVPQRAT